jgi:ArsR family transcriptional regulator, arsenate/arsenite/antimonite-responsive transcriptional repressor
MTEQEAVDAFGALSQEHRLRIVRRLIEEGPDGLAAGALAGAVGISPSNVSFHLSHLERAGLVRSRRKSRCIIYSIMFPAISDLVGFLMNDCCQGHPEICWPDSASTCRPKRKAHV